MKICKKCNNSLPLEKFSRWKYAKDNLKPWCKDCIKEDRLKKRLSGGLQVRIDRSMETESLKICTKCKKLIDRSKFTNNNSWCLNCRMELNRSYTNAKPKFKPIVNLDSKECCKCHNIKPINDFWNNSRGHLGKSSYCKDCQKLYHRTSVSKEKKREYRKKSYYNNLEYSRMLHRLHEFKRKTNINLHRDIKVTNTFIKTLYKTHTHCYYCNKLMTENNKTLEHICPISRGGKHVKGNLTICCSACNFSKGGKTKMEYKLMKLYESRNIS